VLRAYCRKGGYSLREKRTAVCRGLKRRIGNIDFAFDGRGGINFSVNFSKKGGGERYARQHPTNQGDERDSWMQARSQSATCRLRGGFNEEKKGSSWKENSAARREEHSPGERRL